MNSPNMEDSEKNIPKEASSKLLQEKVLKTDSTKELSINSIDEE